MPARFTRENEVVYCGDTRYPGPAYYPAPPEITGTPSQAELDAHPRLFTWGELKEIIPDTSTLGRLSRNKELQARYESWMRGQKERWGGTEKYLMHARLPWADEFKAASASKAGGDDKATPSASGLITPATEPTYDQHTALSHPEIDLTPSTNPDSKPQPSSKPKPSRLSFGRSGAAVAAQHALSPKHARFPSGSGGTPGYSHQATASETATPGSGASTPSSVAYVPIDEALERVSRRLRRKAGSKAGSVRSYASDDESARTSPMHSTRVSAELTRPSVSPPRQAGHSPERTDGADGVDGVREEDAGPDGNYGLKDDELEHDVYLTYDPRRGLDHSKYAVLPNDWPYCVPYGVRHFCVWSRVPIAHPELVGYDRAAWQHIETEGLAGFTGVIPSFTDRSDGAPPGTPTNDGPGRSGPADPHSEGGWYAVDLAYGGREMKRWAGVQFETPGGQKVGEMVRGLWDERGWETIWFVNPARLQSVPGLAHFHVFARRKTPEEIEVSERVFAGPGEITRDMVNLTVDGQDVNGDEKAESRRMRSFAEPAPSPALDDTEAAKPLTVTA
ncbi:cytoplasm protein [Trichosporon asahii var. asahii CBS 8904]|uniref:Cytoplasm protein n=1 Tax=Trichosporon asahii var. asahii (strain CBS 8904) TaxID=1220162 RepID=K1W6G7_TRIAC|nr:cytoplasm protein [Trichosporon asahii var. asahii CBS 8904]